MFNLVLVLKLSQYQSDGLGLGFEISTILIALILGLDLGFETFTILISFILGLGLGFDIVAAVLITSPPLNMQLNQPLWTY